MAMHLQIVTYRMGNISESDFIEANKEFAQMMAAVPGLGAKLWLRGPNGPHRACRSSPRFTLAE